MCRNNRIIGTLVFVSVWCSVCCLIPFPFQGQWILFLCPINYLVYSSTAFNLCVADIHILFSTRFYYATNTQFRADLHLCFLLHVLFLISAILLPHSELDWSIIAKLISLNVTHNCNTTTTSTQLQKRSFHVIKRTRTSSKYEKCTCKACKNTVFHRQICKSVGFFLATREDPSWLFCKYGNHTSFRSYNFRSTTAICRSLRQRFLK